MSLYRSVEQAFAGKNQKCFSMGRQIASDDLDQLFGESR
jgi:hypothetical protein